MIASTTHLLGSLLLALGPQTTAPQDFLKAFNQIDLDRAYEEGTWIDTDRGPVEIRDTGGLEVEGPVGLGEPNVRNGHLDLYSDGSSVPVIEMRDFSSGPSMRLRSHGGTIHSYFGSDSSGGGLLSVGRNSSGSAGVLLDGNYAGFGAARMLVSGSSNFVDINMSQTGNGAVSLPVDSINRLEILDEPGVAAAVTAGGVTLSGAVQTLLSRSITVPASGYVLVIGSLHVQFSHFNLEERSSFGVSDSPGSMPPNQDVIARIAATAGSGFYSIPVTVQAVFPVSGPATRTFYLLADKWGGGTAIAFDRQLSLLFVPSAYGTVTAPSTAAPAPVRGPTLDNAFPGAAAQDVYGPQEIAAERQQEEDRYLDELFDRRRELLRDLEEHHRVLDEILVRERSATQDDG